MAEPREKDQAGEGSHVAAEERIIRFLEPFLAEDVGIRDATRVPVSGPEESRQFQSFHARHPFSQRRSAANQLSAQPQEGVAVGLERRGRQQLLHSVASSVKDTQRGAAVKSSA